MLTRVAPACFVAFVSDGTNLVPNDGNGVADMFVRDRLAGTTVRVTVDRQQPRTRIQRGR